MRPTKGPAWDSRAHRGADALVELCRDYAHVEAVTSPKVHLWVQVPIEGPAEIAGIPLPDSMIETLRAGADVEAVLVDRDHTPITASTTCSVLSPKIARAVVLRDGHCRWPGCTRRHGLQVHHLWPCSWGGGDEIANLAAICTGGGTDHHPQLVPHGPYLLVGNPNQPDGLRLVHRDQIGEQPRPAATIRAGPDAG
jgi:hypothetical protein